MDGPCRNPDQANFLPKRKESSVLLLVVQIHFMAPMVCPYTSFHFFKFMHELRHVILLIKYLSFYTYLILFELWMRVTIVAKLVQIFYKVLELF